MEPNLETATRLFDYVVEFAVEYGFQILGALVFLVIGLKVANWMADRSTKFGDRKSFDPTLNRFVGNIVRVVVIVFVVVITLGNFGITIAPLIALAGASAFGATLAIQGPLSNFGAGLAIILLRPFVVGNTLTVQGVSGVVDTITLAATILVGEDGERITIPNKQIVGEILINSDDHRIVESKLCIAYEDDSERAVAVLRDALAAVPEITDGPAPQVGVHGFSYLGVVLGLRFWVPSQRYFQLRYAVHQAALKALADAGIALKSMSGASVAAEPLLSEGD